MSAADERLYFLIQRAAHSLKKEADARLKAAASITTAQAAVLAVLNSRGPLSQRQLADVLQQRESAMTLMVERLMKAGHIERVRSKTDARAWTLTLSSHGKNALKDIEEPFQAINAHIDEAFGESGALFAEKLQRLLLALGSSEA